MTLRMRIDRLRASGDQGMTLVELIVAMGIFTAMLLVALAATVTMSHSTVRSQVVSDTATQVRNVHQRLDKEVRYASDINQPAESDGDYYVEYLIPASAGTGEAVCVQWRYETDAKELQRRTWEPADHGTVSGWQTLVTDLRNDLSDADQRPFERYEAGEDDGVEFLRQRLAVYLDAGLGDTADGRGSQLKVEMVALNSTGALGTTGSDPVCLGGGVQRP